MVAEACEFCGDMFEAKTARARYCSISCRGKHYYHTHPEYRQEQIDRATDRVKNNPEARAVVLAAGKRWRENNREKASAATKRWYENNKERCAENSKRWFDANPEKRKEYHDRWKKEHPERIRAFWKENTNKRRAMKANADGSHSYAEFLSVCDDAGWLCVYCGCRLDVETATEDHMIPLSRGGANGIENITLSCHSCNSKKHDKTVEEFMAICHTKEVHY